VARHCAASDAPTLLVDLGGLFAEEELQGVRLEEA
jgi:hypothetical protein